MVTFECMACTKHLGIELLLRNRMIITEQAAQQVVGFTDADSSFQGEMIAKSKISELTRALPQNINLGASRLT